MLHLKVFLAIEKYEDRKEWPKGKYFRNNFIFINNIFDINLVHDANTVMRIDRHDLFIFIFIILILFVWLPVTQKFTRFHYVKSTLLTSTLPEL